MVSRVEEHGWEEWWTRDGERKLELLLWALWDPIGSVPLDEYSSYCGSVVKLLRERHQADAHLAERWDVDSVQAERNRLWEQSVESLTQLLIDLRATNMEIERDSRIDREAAVKLLAWYELEMDVMANRQGERRARQG
jgi:hypothetical protein